MCIFHNINLKLASIILLFILVSCKLQEPLKSHGIVFLENRANKLIISKSNKNDVINLIGNPQIIEDENDLKWIYVERILTKGKYHKLGKNVLKENNVLVLEFDRYGILKEKAFFDKNKIKQLKFSNKETETQFTRKSFVEKFLQSVKQKMYSGRKN